MSKKKKKNKQHPPGKKRERKPNHPKDINDTGLYFHGAVIGRIPHMAVAWCYRLVMGGVVMTNDQGIARWGEVGVMKINAKVAGALAAMKAVNNVPPGWCGKVSCTVGEIEQFLCSKNARYLHDVPNKVANGLISGVRRLGSARPGHGRGSNLEACKMICYAQLDFEKNEFFKKNNDYA